MASSRRVTGIIIKEGTTTPQSGLDVRLLTRAGRGLREVAAGTTDARGRFTLDITQAPAIGTDGRYQIEVRSGTTLLAAQGDTQWRKDQDARDLIISVTYAEAVGVPEEGMPNMEAGICGLVRHTDGTPLAELRVKIFAIGLSTESELDDIWEADENNVVVPYVETSSGGWYALPPVPASPLLGLVVKVYEPPPPPPEGQEEGAARLLGTSRVAFRYDGETLLRLDVDVSDDSLRASSEFVQISVDLGEAIVTGVSAALIALTVEQVAWLSGQTEWSVEQIADRALAERIADEMSGGEVAVSPEVIYGLLRMRMPRTAKGLLARPSRALRVALARARRTNVVVHNLSIDDALLSLQGAVANLLDDEGQDALGSILRSGTAAELEYTLSDAQVLEFCALYASFTGELSGDGLATTTEAFWEQAEGLGTFDEAALTEAKRLLQIGTLALGHAACVTAILRVLLDDSAETLATWDTAQWDAVAGNEVEPGEHAVDPLPGGLYGSTEEEKRSSLSLLLQEQAALAFPKKAFRHHFTVGEGSSIASGMGLSSFFGRNGDLDLRDAVLSDDPALWDANPTTAAAEKKAARKAQRLLRIAPRTGSAAAVARLDALGARSASDVARWGKLRTIERYVGDTTGLTEDEILLLTEEAKDVHYRAQNQSAMATMVFAQAAPTLGVANLTFAPTAALTVTDDQVPGWSEAFSSPAGTRCAWCQSVHGPSAYLVDQLRWLDDKKRPSFGSSSPFTSVLKALLDRRPDIEGILLTCENAERVLPAIDLSLEVLEGAVADPEADLVARSSEVESTEMLAAPQYTIDAVYAAGGLGDAVSSFLTPFHQPLTEARAYLAHLGVDRTDLMRAFATGGSPSSAQIGFEELGLSVEGAAAITGAGDEGGYWPFPIGATETVTVADLRRATGITYNEILDLLHTRVANPTAEGADGRLVVRLQGSDPYNLSNYHLRVLDDPGEASPPESAYAPLRKLLRLWKATGWSLIDLDRVLVGLGESDTTAWDDATLEAIADLHRLARLTGLEPVELVAWVAPTMDTWADRETAESPSLSLYGRVFLRASAFPITEQEAEDDDGKALFPFRLDDDGVEITTDRADDWSDDLRVHTGPLQAVLAVDEGEIADLIDALHALDVLDTLTVVVGVEEVEVPGLRLGNLTRLYRWCSLARVLGLRPTEVLRLAELQDAAPEQEGADPIDEGFFASPATVIAFLESTRDLHAAGWSVDELDYLLRHEATERVAPTEDFLRGILGRLRDTVRAQQASTSEADLLDTLSRQLAAELGVDRAFIDTLNQSLWAGATPDASVVSPACFAAGPLTFLHAAGSFTTSASSAVTLTASVSSSGGTIASGTTLTVPSATLLTLVDAGLSVEIDGALRFTAGVLSYIGGAAVGASSVTVPNGTVVELPEGGGARTLTAVASGTLAAAVAGETTTLTDPGDVTPQGFLLRFLREGFVGETASITGGDPWADLLRITDPADVEALIYPMDFAVLEAVSKAVLLQTRLGASAEERDAWLARVEGWSLLDPGHLLANNLATFRDLPVDALFAALESTIRLFALRGRLPGKAPTFAEVIDAPSAETIAARTGWDLAVLSSLLEGEAASAEALEDVLDRMDIVRRCGADPVVVTTWAGVGDLGTFLPSTARTVVSAARSRHPSAGAWSGISRRIRDGVRKAQRDALVSYLIATSTQGFEDADDIYQYYLIDVSMNPEMLTSRIVAATNAVQLFVHRCLFGLEQQAEDADVGNWFTDDDRLEWEWRRTYRVWEAARKVFLYPENWIEPELRDDKSFFFRALEQELAQGEITADRAEQVTLDYLDRLREVASLQVLACYVQKEDDTDILHVFGRTRSEPATYWYRRRENSSTWTAWEKVEGGVEGNLLLPVVYNRRLLLIWPLFTEVQADDEEAEPASWWDIRLAISEYRDGKWQARRVSADPVPNADWCALVRSRFSMVSTETSDGRLLISLILINTVAYGHGDAAWYEYATVELDPYTMGMKMGASQPFDSYRISTNTSFWEAPGFTTAEWDEDDDRIDSLSVYVGELDDDGESNGRVRLMPVLATAYDGTVVVSNQWADFVSQAPFFLNIDGRAYFVEPSITQDEDLAEVESSGAAGLSVGGLGGFRKGTHPAEEDAETEEDSEDDLYTWTDRLPPHHFASRDGAVGALRAVSAGLRGDDYTGPVSLPEVAFRFTPFYHPYVGDFVREVRREGIFGLLDPNPSGPGKDLFRQALTDGTETFEDHGPTRYVDEDYPVEEIDFSQEGAYSQYNWEIFFHLPFYVATRLATEGRHQEAINWFHTMFDPRTRAAVDTAGIEGAVDTATWWKVKPFLLSASAPVTDWLAFSGAGGSAVRQKRFESQVAAWAEDPFNPHLLARLRPGTYQRALVMRYLDTLLDWGDTLFTRDTLETINEATQLYVFAKQVLGDRPEFVGDTEKPTPQSFADLQESLDAFGNATVTLENASFAAQGRGTISLRPGMSVFRSVGQSTYFCVPFNSRLLSYWDTVDDRLFKIRNGMNIAGVVRSLPLFQPPIDPALLVRAAAAGVDIGTAAAGGATVGNYRFAVLLARAQALTGTVRGLGQALLGAIEKRDAEALALLRQAQEGALLAAVTGVREQQLADAKASLDALRLSKTITQTRHDYYDKLINKGWSSSESEAAELTDLSIDRNLMAVGIAAESAIIAVAPDITLGVTSGTTLGGSTIANVYAAGAAALAGAAGIAAARAGRLSMSASYSRRAEEWTNQKKLAAKELTQLSKQIVGAEIRLEIAKREIKNHELQIRHSAEVRDWMERKYTSKELYDWMVSQLSALHFQSWQLAYSVARKAEAAYNYELGRTDSFVRPVHWDSTRKGLLAGDRLQLDLERMDIAYLDNDVRELELTKRISLRRLDPLALARFQATGECWFDVPEAIFDLDCPGHYFRRIQSVAVTVACVGGPAAEVNVRLTQHGFKLRVSAETGTAEDVLIVDTTTSSPIVTSHGQEDTGLFQTDLKDPRYLPFERRGAISTWNIAFENTKISQIDRSEITDVILSLRYTARDGGTTFRTSVLGGLHTRLDELAGGYTGTDGATSPTSAGLSLVLSARRDFPEEWYTAQTVEVEGVGTFEVDLPSSLLPYFAVGRVNDIRFVHVVTDGSAPTTVLQIPSGTAAGLGALWAWPGDGSGLIHGATSDLSLTAWPASLKLTFSTPSFASRSDVIIVIEYSISSS